ncbi:MAG: DUF2029 domain-containing protein [Actinobacteria bacterium]|nr:DUF2029 domain-containing protein [Actinomycetota bacterium]
MAMFVFAAAVGVLLSASIASGPVILDARWGTLIRLSLWGLAWIAAVAAALRLPTRVALCLTFGTGLALRLAALAGPPVTSDDLFRYAWDARVQDVGVNPYRYPPASEELAGLREPWLWPDEVGCTELDRPPGCTRINRPSAPTIYPPLAQAWFLAVDELAPDGARHTTWQVAGLITEVGVLALVPVALGRWGGDRRWSALYALSPAPVMEIVQNGHVDGVAILAVLGALVVVAPTSDSTRSRALRQVSAGALIGAAAMVKLYPAVLVLALVGVGGSRRTAVLVRAGAGACTVAVMAYLPQVVSVGWRVLGYLPGYLEEEDYIEGGRFLVATALGLPPAMAALASASAALGIACWVLVQRPAPPVGAAALLGALLLATSPVQPWYAVALLAAATVAVRPWWGAVMVAGYPYYFSVILDHPFAVVLGRLTYVTALVVIVAGAWRSRAVRPDRKQGPGHENLGTVDAQKSLWRPQEKTSR